MLLAAMAPRMLQLAGAVADGTVLWMTGPQAIAEHVVPRLADAAAEAGRARAESRVRVAGLRHRRRSRGPGPGREGVRDLRHLPSYKAMLDREGAGGPGDVAIVGDEAAVASRSTTLAAIGVTDFVAGEFATGEDAARTRTLLNDLATGSH